MCCVRFNWSSNMEEVSQNEKVFKLYGKFLVKFEYICHLMRFGILYLVFPNYSDKQTRQNEILLESLTADQIKNKFLALITEECDSKSETFKLSKIICNVYERIIPIRNSFAHGTSFIGNSPVMKDSKDGLLLLRHPKLRKEGLDLNYKKYEIAALEFGIQLFERMIYAVAAVSVTFVKKEGKPKYTDGYSPDLHFEALGKELLRMEKKLQGLLK